MAEKKYCVTLSVNITGDDGVGFLDSHLVYKDMDYGDVTLVEETLIKAMTTLNEFAKSRKKYTDPKGN